MAKKSSPTQTSCLVQNREAQCLSIRTCFNPRFILWHLVFFLTFQMPTFAIAFVHTSLFLCRQLLQHFFVKGAIIELASLYPIESIAYSLQVVLRFLPLVLPESL